VRVLTHIGKLEDAHRRIRPRNRKDYRGRLWATRQRLWIDRVASAWMIRRFIDPQAKFLWLKRVKDCPKRAVGFDFDGAEFTHADSKVTFEVLVASFGLHEDPGLARLGALVHHLDVWGIPIAEGPGFRIPTSLNPGRSQAQKTQLQPLPSVSLAATERSDHRRCVWKQSAGCQSSLRRCSAYRHPSSTPPQWGCCGSWK
jgi:hypothetical protein